MVFWSHLDLGSPIQCYLPVRQHLPEGRQAWALKEPVFSNNGELARRSNFFHARVRCHHNHRITERF